MEIFLISLSLLAIFISITLTFFFHNRKSGGVDAKLPPGSFGLPIIGETLEFLYGNPENFVGNRMNKHSPKVFKTTILGEPTAVICGPAGNKFIFSNEQKLVDTWRPHSMQKLFRKYKTNADATPRPVQQNMPTAESLTLRQPGFFKPQALMRFLSKMDSVTQEYVKMHWEGKDEVKVFPLAKSFTLTLAFQFFLGLDDPEMIARLVGKFDDITLGLHSIPLNFPGTTFYRANKASGAIRKELQMKVREKKLAMSNGTAPMQDVMSHMIVATDPSTGRFMPEVEIADKMMGLLVAGYSTVATAITFTMKYIGEKPDVYEKIRREQTEITNSKKVGEALDWEDIQKMKYSWNVVYEVMRFAPPLQGTFREAITDITYAGFTIPKGWKIYWTVSSTSKNPEYFPDPEKFDPSRYEGNGPAPYTFVPFGGGPRLCPGKEYARLVILTFLHNVVKKFRWEVMFPNEKMIADMMPIPTQGLPIRLRRH